MTKCKLTSKRLWQNRARQKIALLVADDLAAAFETPLAGATISLIFRPKSLMLLVIVCAQNA